MPSYKLEFKPSLEKDLADIPRSIRDNVWKRIIGLAEDPCPAQALKLKGVRFSWRLRDGNYRILYQIDDAHRTIDVMAVKHRKEAYR